MAISATACASFTDVYDVVQQNYAEPVNADKAIYNGAIPGMLHVLDPHSNFFDPKSYSLLREEQRGKYYGVGMQVGPRNNKVIVIAPFAGTPGVSRRHSSGRRDHRRRRQVHRQHEHQRRCRSAQRPQGHDGSRSRSCAKAPTSRWTSTLCATRFRATASTFIS